MKIEKTSYDDCISRQAVLDAMSELNAISFYEAQEDSKECYCEIKKAIEALPPVCPKAKVCKWIKYDYRTVCPREHDVDNPYWRIPENRMDTLKYCPYCGGKIEVEE